jgi:hypothetical protein
MHTAEAGLDEPCTSDVVIHLFCFTDYVPARRQGRAPRCRLTTGSCSWTFVTPAAAQASAMRAADPAQRISAGIAHSIGPGPRTLPTSTSLHDVLECMRHP